MNKYSENFITIAKHPVKFRMFLFLNLPSAFFSGIKIKKISNVECQVIVPFTWFTKNPFKSVYFACLSMAAELSTGALVMLNTYKRLPRCSMLVQECKASFVKKAISPIIFTCVNGSEIRECIDEAYLTNQPQKIIARSEGRNLLNEVVATFEFTWSFKAKN